MKMNWLLIFVPITVVLEHAAPQAHTWIFFSACLAIIPIATLIVGATEQIASRTGDRIGSRERSSAQCTS
jgi:Ca2+:H+ antiporter